MKTRRDFLKTGTAAVTLMVMDRPVLSLNKLYGGTHPQDDDLLVQSAELLETWGKGLLRQQVRNPDLKGFYGGLLCPSCSTVHGRVGDAVFPFMYLAGHTGRQDYLDAAILLFDWMQEMVSYPDGSWVNDVNISLWKGITVFGSIALAEALVHHGDLLDNALKARWTDRLARAGDYLFNNITIRTGNINYPATCSYALSLLGAYLDKAAYRAKGKALAHECMPFFTVDNHLLSGEGKPIDSLSDRGCYPVDLGYNVEESLPSLLMYGRLTGDSDVLDAVYRSLSAHLEFMLPDGGWDNSWGTRNYKWTYWGSRTSDGCQPGYALAAHRDPRFYKAALKNLQLLMACTHEGLLHGGPHYRDQGILPCIHHTFCHSKALTTVLEHKGEIDVPDAVKDIRLPRETEYGVKFFSEIMTWLVSRGSWRGTVTAYDFRYRVHNGHATGGAISMLWHEKAGPVLVASMNEYELSEAHNMQMDKSANPMSLTPRFELQKHGDVYMNTADARADVRFAESEGQVVFTTSAHLVNGDREAPPDGEAGCRVEYEFRDDVFSIRARHEAPGRGIRFLLPVVADSRDEVRQENSRRIEIIKPGTILLVESDAEMRIAGISGDRIFNFVPGMAAVPISIESHDFNVSMLSFPAH